VPESVLTILKYCFLALVYVFLLRVVQIVLREMRVPKAAAAADAAVAAAPAPRKRGPGLRLRMLEPASREGETIALGDELTVGRGGGCGIVLADDQFVSTVHARVFRRGDDVFVEDLGSRNGTFVNGHPVDGTTRIRRGDRVQFGQTVAELLR
jgi:pSer/pThr/pTyr-binding forkhead associated (FHA) protein